MQKCLKSAFFGSKTQLSKIRRILSFCRKNVLYGSNEAQRAILFENGYCVPIVLKLPHSLVNLSNIAHFWLFFQISSVKNGGKHWIWHDFQWTSQLQKSSEVSVLAWKSSYIAQKMRKELYFWIHMQNKCLEPYSRVYRLLFKKHPKISSLCYPLK